MLLIGLGVGVDYALFIVTRHRQGLHAGARIEEPIITAVDTSGRAVLFAGIIVCIALLGMFALQVGFLSAWRWPPHRRGLHDARCAHLLPALLSFIGPRVLSRRQRRKLAEEGPRIVGPDHGLLAPVGRLHAQRRPVIPAAAGLLVVRLLGAARSSAMRLGTADQGNDPQGTTTRTAYDLLASGFGPGFNGPLQLVAVTTDAGEQAAFRSTIDQVAKRPAWPRPLLRSPSRPPTARR